MGQNRQIHNINLPYLFTYLYIIIIKLIKDTYIEGVEVLSMILPLMVTKM